MLHVARDGSSSGELPEFVPDFVARYAALPLEERLRRKCRCLTKDGAIIVECITCEALRTINELRERGADSDGRSSSSQSVPAERRREAVSTTQRRESHH